MENQILVVKNKKEEKFLRKKIESVEIKSLTHREINDLVAKMKKAMRAANGIGLSANQIGLPLRLFVAEVPNAQGEMKFYAVFNPKIEKAGVETAIAEEGCLSVPGLYGGVERKARLTLSGIDKNGKPLKIKAWGLLARVFQHELDHLNGILFIDKAKNLHQMTTKEEK